MISITTAENALRDAYLSAACNQLNTKTNPLFASIKQSSNDVFGKQIIKAAPIGINGGIGAGSETGALPTNGNTQYKQFKTTLKNLYGSIEISDKAIRASAADAGAFVNLLNYEIDALLAASKFNLGRMMFGDGSGKLGDVSSYNATTGAVTFASVKNFVEGMIVDCYNDGTIVSANSGARIDYVDRTNKCIYFTTKPSVTLTDDHSFYVQGSKDNEITGLGAIFSTTGSLYGLTKTDNLWLNPYINSTSTDISDDVIQTAIDTLEENTGSEINFIVCGAATRRAYQSYLSDYKRNVDVMNLEGGHRAISFNGIPVVSDRFAADNAMYLLNTNAFTLHQLCDWEWLTSEGGNILRQKPGYAAYNATLVKYADLICEQPNGQAMFSNISLS